MNLILGEYAPKARCRPPGTMPPDLKTYCQAVISAMSTKTQTEVFGPASDPATEVITPTFIKAGEKVDPLFQSFNYTDTEYYRYERVHVKSFHPRVVRLYLLV